MRSALVDAGIRMGATCGFALGLAGWLQLGRLEGLANALITVGGGGIACGLYGAASAPDLNRAVSPHAVLARDRTTFLACMGVALVAGTTITITATLGPNLATGKPNGLLIGLGVGLADLVGLGLPFAFYQAVWGQYILDRCRLAFSRRLPWDLISFLDDARDRGVLRQVGAVYRFRHIDLQRRLARNDTAQS